MNLAFSVTYTLLTGLGLASWLFFRADVSRIVSLRGSFERLFPILSQVVCRDDGQSYSRVHDIAIFLT